MDSLVRFLDPLLPLALLVTTVAYFLDFRSDSRKRSVWVTATLAVTFTLLVVRFVAFLLAEGRPPLATPDEGFGTIALSIVAVYALLEMAHRERSLGFPLLGAATLAEIFAVFRQTDPAHVSDLLRQPWFGFHATSAILGYTAFAVSAVYGALFVALYVSLKRARFGIAFERMPSLDVLSRSAIRSATFGFAFLTASIVAGAFGWARLLEGPVWLDPKVLSTMLAWVVYGTGVSLWHFRGWRGIRAVGLTLVAFAIMVLSTWIVPWALGSAHGVRGIA